MYRFFRISEHNYLSYLYLPAEYYHPLSKVLGCYVVVSEENTNNWSWMREADFKKRWLVVEQGLSLGGFRKVVPRNA